MVVELLSATALGRAFARVLNRGDNNKAQPAAIAKALRLKDMNFLVISFEYAYLIKTIAHLAWDYRPKFWRLVLESAL